MPFYTFIMDYRGGTYTSQINSTSIETACVDWAETLEVSEVWNFGKSSKEKLIEKMKDETPVLLDGLINVWCVSAIIRGELALIHFVKTENLTDNERPPNHN